MWIINDMQKELLLRRMSLKVFLIRNLQLLKINGLIKNGKIWQRKEIKRLDVENIRYPWIILEPIKSLRNEKEKKKKYLNIASWVATKSLISFRKNMEGCIPIFSWLFWVEAHFCLRFGSWDHCVNRICVLEHVNTILNS